MEDCVGVNVLVDEVDVSVVVVSVVVDPVNSRKCAESRPISVVCA